MRLGFGKNSRKFYVFSSNYIFIQYQHNQQWHISYDVIHSMLPKASTCMYDLGCPSGFTVDIHVITMVRIRLWLFGIISAMLGLRMLQLLCRLPIKLHSYSGASPGFGRGEAKNLFFRFGNLHVAKRHAAHGEAMRIARGVRGHAPPRKFFKRLQIGAF